MDGGNKGEEDLKLIPLLKDRSMKTHFPQSPMVDQQFKECLDYLWRPIC